MKIKKRIVYVIGTRPEIIRSAFVINKLKKDKSIDFKLVHTGQHYDFLMDRVFFEELGVSRPDINLKVGSGTHAQQTAEIMIKLENFFLKYKPDIVAAFGDTNSGLAAALTAVKMKIPFAHLEAGGREFEMDIPEEINRIIIDRISNLLLAFSDTFVNNLNNEKVLGDIYNTGDTLFEVFQEIQRKQNILKFSKDKKQDYVFFTLHRDKNVDNLENLRKILNALKSFSNTKFIFPVHPRTRKQLEKVNIELNNFSMIDPLSYGDTIHHIANSKFVITDSGGMQKEAFWLKKPCIILRTATSWIEPVKEGVNFFCVINENKIIEKINYVVSNYKNLIRKYAKISNPYYKKNTSGICVELIKKYAGKKW
jgi:UDP-GlcNAc3NAcA epimerase